MRTPLRRRTTASLVIGAIATVALVGCSATTTPTAAHQTVTVYGAFTGVQATQFEKAWSGWEKKNNITISYSGDASFAQDVVTKIQGNSVANIAVFPQPGLLDAAIQTGKVVPLGATADANLKKNFSSDWQQYVTYKGKQYATPIDANVKGFVWYSPANFKKWGITVPTTYTQLLADTATIQEKTGQAPWCAGFSSGAASGWPGADWLAEVVLGSAGAKTYDSWVAGKTKFTSPAINTAFTDLGKIFQNPKYVNAGFGNISSVNAAGYGDVAAKVANGTCALTNQGTFLESNFSTVKTASGATPKIGPNGDVWVFPLPSVTPGQTAAVGGGDFAAAFSKSAATQKVLTYLASTDWGNSLITVKGSSFFNATKGVPASEEKDPLLSKAIQTLQSSSTVFRFGADDAMPNVVETAFWGGMVSWINGTPQAQVEQQIQGAWASAK